MTTTDTFNAVDFFADLERTRYDRLTACQAWEHETGWKVGTIAPALPKGFTRHPARWNWYTLNDGRQVHAFDHTFRITRPGSPAAILTMPYGLSDGDAADLSEWCRERSGTWHVAGGGWWHRLTLGIIITPTVEPTR